MMRDITVFQDFHRALTDAIHSWGADAAAAPLWATIIMAVLSLLVMFIIFSILRAGFKGKIRDVQRKCEALKENTKVTVSAPEMKPEIHEVETYTPDSRPWQTKSLRMEGQLELLTELRERGKISQVEYEIQRRRILEEV